MSKYRKSKWKLDYYSQGFIKSKNLKSKSRRTLKRIAKCLFEKDMNKE